MSAGRKSAGGNLEWGTPEKYVTPIKRFFGGSIELDPCSNAHSIVGAEVEYRLPENGLEESWAFRTIFVNPPYGRGIDDWLLRCAEINAGRGTEVIALIPVATNTGHWKRNIYGKAAAVCFLHDTRLKFLEGGVESKKGAPMACCLVYWGKRVHEFTAQFSSFGTVMTEAVLMPEGVGTPREIKPDFQDGS